MKKIKRIFTILIIFLLTSCATDFFYLYVPISCLDVSQKTIHKKVKIERFQDSSPITDTNDPLLGSSLVYPKVWNDTIVSFFVTQAMIFDFNNNALFDEIGTDVKDYDYVLKGDIKRFMSTTRPTVYGYISSLTLVGIITWYFGFPIEKSEAEIEISLSLYNKNGEKIYECNSESNAKIRSNFYRHRIGQMGKNTNKTFSNVVKGLRDQLINNFE